MSDITYETDAGSPGASALPGAGVSSRRVVEQLDEAACLELLSTGRIGRLIYTSRYGPVALPSEYKMHDGSIVFRTYRVTFTEEDLRKSSATSSLAAHNRMIGAAFVELATTPTAQPNRSGTRWASVPITLSDHGWSAARRVRSTVLHTILAWPPCR